MDKEFLSDVENAYQGYLEFKHDEYLLGNWITPFGKILAIAGVRSKNISRQKVLI